MGFEIVTSVDGVSDGGFADQTADTAKVSQAAASTER